jgi:hypothetical protein
MMQGLGRENVSGKENRGCCLVGSFAEDNRTGGAQ